MKRMTTLLFVFLMTALTTIVGNTSIAMDGNLDQTNLLTATTDKGADFPTDIVVGSTDLFDQQAHSVAINVTGNEGTIQGMTQALASFAQDASMWGSCAQQNKRNLATDAIAIVESSGGNSSLTENVIASTIVETNTADVITASKGSGGNFFHTGKIIVASTPVETAAGVMMTYTTT